MDDNNRTLETLGFLWILTLVIGTLGYILYTLIIMPIKYLVWLKLERKNHPDSVTKPYGYYYVAYGFLVIMTVAWIVEFCTGRWQFEPKTHFIYFALLGFPAYYSVIGLQKEFLMIRGDTKFHMKKDFVAMNIEFVIRLIFGLFLTIMIILAAFQAYPIK